VLVDHEVLHGYAHLPEIRYALGRLGRRLRRPVDLAGLVDPLLRHERRLHARFPSYFQDMRRAANGSGQEEETWP
jgi:acyl carrier protein phosphodiesterase